MTRVARTPLTMVRNLRRPITGGVGASWSADRPQHAARSTRNGSGPGRRGTDHVFGDEAARGEALAEGVGGERLHDLAIRGDAVRERIVAHEGAGLLELGHHPGQAHGKGGREVETLV